MRYLFHRVSFDGQSLLWSYKHRTDSGFTDFYHWHQCCEILFVHEGQGHVTVNHQTFEMKRGMLFFFQPFQLHKVLTRAGDDHPYVRTVIYFDPVFLAEPLRPFPSRRDLFARLWQGKNDRPAFDMTHVLDHVERTFHMLDGSVASGKGAAAGEADEEYALMLLQILNGMAYLRQDMAALKPEGGGTRRFRYSEIIMQWIEGHYAENIGLDDVADALHLSKFYVSRIFRQENGSSITDYVTARRIKQACRLLQTTTLPVEQIGAEVGIPNASYFIRLFRKVIGTTPLKYRNQGP